MSSLEILRAHPSDGISLGDLRCLDFLDFLPRDSCQFTRPDSAAAVEDFFLVHHHRIQERVRIDVVRQMLELIFTSERKQIGNGMPAGVVLHAQLPWYLLSGAAPAE